MQDRRSRRRSQRSEYFPTLTICMAVLLCASCASHVPKFAPSSVQVCAEYSRDRALDEDYRRSRRLGTSACLTFDDRSDEEE